MILNLTERASERAFTIAGGGVGSIVGWFQLSLPKIILSMSVHEWVDFVLTVTIGSAIGWGIHQLLSWCKKKYNKRCKK